MTARFPLLPHSAPGMCRQVVAHLMPDLPNVGWERDVESFAEFFENPAFRTDGLKLYPTLVIRGTGLYELWKAGLYRNYDPSLLVELVRRAASNLLESSQEGTPRKISSQGNLWLRSAHIPPCTCVHAYLHHWMRHVMPSVPAWCAKSAAPCVPDQHITDITPTARRQQVAAASCCFPGCAPQAPRASPPMRRVKSGP